MIPQKCPIALPKFPLVKLNLTYWEHFAQHIYIDVPKKLLKYKNMEIPEFLYIPSRILMHPSFSIM